MNKYILNILTQYKKGKMQFISQLNDNLVSQIINSTVKLNRIRHKFCNGIRYGNTVIYKIGLSILNYQLE